MPVDFKQRNAEVVMKTFGYDMIDQDDMLTVVATCSDDMQSMDNDDIMHDVLIEVGFLKPTKSITMRGTILYQAEFDRLLKIGGQIEDNGYIVTYEANVV